VGNTYYALTTGNWTGNVPVRSSTNLVTWSAATDALPQLGSWASIGNTWAPDLVHRVDGSGNGYWVMYYTATHTASGDQCIGTAVSYDAPLGSGVAGPYQDASAAPFVCQNPLDGSIDADVYVPDPQGPNPQAYLFWKSNEAAVTGHRSIWSQPLDATGLAFRSGTSAIKVMTSEEGWENLLVEGPSVFWDAGSQQQRRGFCLCSARHCELSKDRSPVLRVSTVGMVRLDLERVRGAVAAIDPVFLGTPQFEVGALSEALGCSVTLKVETLNPVRSFKGRGTETVLSALVREGRCSSVVCASAGNLGQALAYSGARRGIPVTVFAAETASPLKIDRMQSLGATVHLEGDDIETPRVLARAHAEDNGSYLVEDSLDLGTCEGAATIGLELAAAPAAAFDVVLVALGGGALASGVGHVMRELSPETQVVAIQPVGAPAMALSWRKRTVVTTDTIDTIADGVAGRYPIPEVLEDLLEVVDDVVLVDEASIKDGMRHLFDLAGLVTEPSAALGIAAILEDPDRFRGRTIATIICGSNVSPADFRRWAVSPGR
jgi:threonine dehydratase